MRRCDGCNDFTHRSAPYESSEYVFSESRLSRGRARSWSFVERKSWSGAQLHHRRKQARPERNGRACDTVWRPGVPMLSYPPRELWPEKIYDLPELAYPQTLNACYELLDINLALGRGSAPAIYSTDSV